MIPQSISDSHLTSAVAVGVVAWGAMKWAGDVASEQTNRSIARWLKGKALDASLRVDPMANWHQTFAQLFDNTFGKKHLTWQCFMKSAFATLIAVLFSIAFGIVTSFDQWDLHELTRTIRVMIVCYLIVCVIPDYVSLLETRMILRFMSWTDSSTKHAMLLCLDLVLTVSIATIASQVFVFPIKAFFIEDGDIMKYNGVTFRLSSGHHMYAALLNFKQHPFDAALEMITRTSPGAISLNRVFMLPAFLTSLWLWVYAGAGLLIKSARSIPLGLALLVRYGEFEKKPLHLINPVASFLVMVLSYLVLKALG